MVGVVTRFHRLPPLQGTELDSVARVLGFRRVRRYRRDWRWLWLRYRPESDAELRGRILTFYNAKFWGLVGRL